MKFSIIVFLIIALFGCNKDEIAQLEEKNSQMQTENKLLAEESAMKDEFIQEYTNTVNAVYENLDKIRKREGFLVKATRDLEKGKNTSLKAKMLSNISSIDKYLRNSKSRIRKLKSKLNEWQIKTEALENMVAKLNQAVEVKENEINELKHNLEELNIKVAEATSQIEEKNELIAQQTEQLNTVYYIIGTEKELKEKGIIEEKGGFLGFRKTKKLAAGFNQDYFVPANIATTETIPLGQKIGDVKIVSPHSPASYQLVQQEDASGVLEITDPEEFWKLKYLVIIAKN